MKIKNISSVLFLWCALCISTAIASSSTSSVATIYIAGLPADTTIILNDKKVGRTDDHGEVVFTPQQGWYNLRAEKFDSSENLIRYTEQSFYVYSGDVLNLLDLTLSETEPHREDITALLDGYMVEVPGGVFRMGNNENEHEKPAHFVKIQPFMIGTTEITFDLYDLFSKSNNKHLMNDRGWGRGKQPVYLVTKSEALQFIDWLNAKLKPEYPYRLPSEAEWEYAARAGTKTKYWWGDEVGTNNANCKGCGSQWDGISPAPVASFSPNPFGLYDTVGNVYEWVDDCWHDNYQGAPLNGSVWSDIPLSRSRKCHPSLLGNYVLRGGNFNALPEEASASYRYRARLRRFRGFRLAQDI